MQPAARRNLLELVRQLLRLLEGCLLLGAKLNQVVLGAEQADLMFLELGVERGSRRRQEVELDEQLRAFTEDAIERIRRMLAEGLTPPPVNDRRCRDCSLIDACQPELMDRLLSAPPGRRLFVPDDGIGLD